MPAPKKAAQPKDHLRPKTKAVAAEATPQGFTFTHDDVVYELPAAAPYMSATDGGSFMDAMLEGEQGDLKLSMLALKAARDDIDPKAWEALRAKPLPEFLETVGGWLTATVGADLGESDSSST